MTRITRFSLISIFTLATAACSSSAPPANTADPTPSPTAQHGTALPFTISDAVISSAYQNDMKVAQITVNVAGGKAPDWAATAIRVAEKAVSAGADAAKVDVNRADVANRGDVPNMFRHYAEVYYGPDKDKTPWNDKNWKPWSIYIAESPVSLKQINIWNDFQHMNQQLIDHGTDFNQADKIAGRQVAKKYHLKADWQLPIGNLSSKEYGRADFAIDQDQSKASQEALATCLAQSLSAFMTGCHLKPL